MDLKKTLILPSTSFEMRGNLNQKEPLILERWNKEDIYKQANSLRKGKPYVLHDGPPYANGKFHLGHMLNRALKDFVVRFQNMQGHPTPIRYGWDTHGLPIENVLGKKGIKWREVGVTNFREMCKTYALEQVELQKKTAVRFGTMSDVKNPYITLNKDYEGSQIRVFSKLATRGLIYKGLKPVHWSPSSETALAEAEIEYKDVESYEIFVSFRITKENQYVSKGDKLIIWTTTPWTLPANLAVCLHPEFVYGLYESNLGRIVVLEKLLPDLINKLDLKDVKLIHTFKGSALDKLKVQHPFYDRTSLVINGRHVTDETGTGIVHTAPGHGLEDYNVCLNYNIEPYCPVNSKGFFDETVGPKLEHVFYEKGNEIVLDLLKENNALIYVNKFIHAYPHDWRTKKPLIFRATPQWFCSIEPIRNELLDVIENVKWYHSWSKLRMVNMIKDRVDWCISRQRVWGVPIPMIICEDGTPIIDEAIFENIAKEFEKYGSNIWFEKAATYFLPKDYQNIHSPNGIFSKEKDIMDVWFDSGSSFNGVLVKDGIFPSDLYLEGSDQYRGWFNASLILSVATTGQSPFKACISHGFIQDQSGEKMSKSKGNTMDPEVLMNTYGADILRLWAALSDYAQDVKISPDALNKISEVYKKIRNTFRFMLGNLTNGAPESKHTPFDPKKDKVDSLELIDQIVLNKFNEVKNNYINKFNELDFINALNPLIAFFSNEMSSLYLDLAKDVLYCDHVSSKRRKQMQNVIYIVLTESMRLLNPVLVFTMDEVNRALSKPLSENVQYLDMPSISPLPYPEAELLTNPLLSLRSDVLLALEQLRQDKQIGSALDANVSLVISDQLLNKTISTLEAKEAARLFGVSQLKVLENKRDAVDKYQVHEVNGNIIYVSVSSSEKCERCWNHSNSIVVTNEHHLCPRCYDVLKKEGELENE